MIQDVPPSASSNNNTLSDKNVLLISEKIENVTKDLTDDEREMIARGVLPLRILEKFPEIKKASILTKLWEHVNRRVVISENDGIEGLIQNGKFGCIKLIRMVSQNGNETEIARDIVRFDGYFGPVILIDFKTPGIQFKTPFEEVKLSEDDFITYMRQKYSLNSFQVHELKQVCDAFIREELTNGNFEYYSRSLINVIDDRIVINYPDGDVAQDLRQLRDFYDKTTNQSAYVLLFGWSLLAPVHSSLKEKARTSIQTPLVALTGHTQAGKTAVGSLFIGLGFNQEKNSYFFPYERIRTPYTLMKHLSESNLPALFDDIPATWNFIHKDNIKSYTQTRHFGDRGRGDQTLVQYDGVRSFVETLNEHISIDEDLALSVRLIIERFDKVSAEKKNLDQWSEFVNAISPGFMLRIFKESFNDVNIYEILDVVEKFEDSYQWINLGINKINILCDKYGIPHFPYYEPPTKANYISNALEISQAFLGEWERIITSEQEALMDDGDGGRIPVTKLKYRSKIEGEFAVESRTETQQNGTKQWRDYIYFTGSAFKTLVSTQGLRVPYNNATNFINNIATEDVVRVENNGKLVSRRIGDKVLKCFCISVPEFEEDKI